MNDVFLPTLLVAPYALYYATFGEVYGLDCFHLAVLSSISQHRHLRSFILGSNFFISRENSDTSSDPTSIN